MKATQVEWHGEGEEEEKRRMRRKRSHTGGAWLCDREMVHGSMTARTMDSSGPIWPPSCKDIPTNTHA